MPSSTSSSEDRRAARRLGALAAAFLAINAFILAVWQLVPFTSISEERYLATIEDHLLMLERSKGQPGRVVVLGGSDVAFSISAETLASGLDRPVYNGGIQASMGFRNLMDLYLPHLDPERDLIVLSVEPYLLIGDSRHSQSWCDVIYLRRDLAGLLARPRCVPQIVDRTFSEVRYHVQTPPAVDPVYRRSGFNAVGDQTAHLQLEWPPPDLTGHSYAGLTDTMVTRFERYVGRELRDRGFAIAYMPSFMPERTCKAERQRLEALVERLSRLSTRPAPHYSLEQSCLPEEMFLDGAGHLNARGRLVATRRARDAILYASQN